jgi:hypothetical protein
LVTGSETAVAGWLLGVIAPGVRESELSLLH